MASSDQVARGGVATATLDRPYARAPFALRPPRTGPRGPRGRARSSNSERTALVATAVAIALVPWIKPSGPANLGVADVFMGLAVVTCALWMSAVRHKLRFPFIVGIVLMLAGGALGALAGPVPGKAAAALAQDIWLFVWCWAVVNFASSAGRLRVLLATWAYSAVAWSTLLIAALIAGWPSLAGITDAEGSRTTLTFGDPSYSASYYFISIMVIWACGYPRHRSARIAAYTMLVIAILSTGSNSGLVSLTVGVAVATVLGAMARWGWAAGIPIIGALVVAAVLLVSGVNVRQEQEKAHSSQYAFVRDGLGRSEDSASLRGRLLDESIELVKAGGPVGTGPVSTKPRLQAERAPVIKEAHDDYLASILERGVLGLLGLFALLASLGARALPLARARLGGEFSSVVPRPYALLGAVAGTVAAMSAYELLHVRHVWALFALIAAASIWGEAGRRGRGPGRRGSRRVVADLHR